jgi:hypothetical protein
MVTKQENATKTATITLYYLEVEVNFDIVVLDLQSIKDSVSYYLSEGFSAKRSYEKKETVNWENKIVVVTAVKAVEGKRHFSVEFALRDDPEQKGSMITFDKNTYRKNDVLSLFKNDKGYLTGELWSDDKLPL